MDFKAVLCDIPPSFIPCSSIEASSTNTAYSNIELLKGTYNEPFPVATLGYHSWKLDGKHKALGDTCHVPYISTSVSSDNYSEACKGYSLGTTPIITKTFDTPQPIKGINIITAPDVYATSIQVTFFYKNENGVTTFDTEVVYPTSNEFFIEKPLEKCTMIKAVFSAISKPNNYFVLFNLLEARTYEFDRNKITACTLLEETSVLNTSMPSNSLEMEVKSTEGVNFLQKQPITIFLDGEKRGTFYIDSVERENSCTYRIIAYDIISLLDSYKFYNEFLNGYWGRTDVSGSEAVSTITLKSLLDMIFKHLPYSYEAPDINITLAQTDSLPPCGAKPSDGGWNGQYVRGMGYLFEADNCREALLKVLLGCKLQYEVSDDNTFVFSIWKKGSSRVIPVSDTFIGGNVVDDASVTMLSLKVKKSYSTLTETQYTYTDSLGKTVTVSQKETESYTLSPSDDWTVVEASRYATWYLSPTRISSLSDKGITFDFKHPGWFRYKNTTGKDYKLTLDILDLHSADCLYSRFFYAGDTTGEDTAVSCGFINDSADVPKHFDNYYKNNKYFEGNIVIPSDLKCGDTIKLSTEWQGDFVGIVEQIEYSLQGGQKLIGKVKVHAYG